MNTSSGITLERVMAMIEHWARTPIGSYLWNNYGHEFKRDLHEPINELDGQARLNKLLTDVPLVQRFNMFIELKYSQIASDKVSYSIEVMGNGFTRSIQVVA